MGTIPVTIKGKVKQTDSGAEEDVLITGDLWITGLSVGGGPVLPPDQPPPNTPPGTPTFPIWGPPGIDLPDIPGYPPVAGHPLPPVPDPPPDLSKPPAFVPIWTPDTGWVVIPAFPHPAPSKRRK